MQKVSFLKAYLLAYKFYDLWPKCVTRKLFMIVGCLVTDKEEGSKERETETEYKN